MYQQAFQTCETARHIVAVPCIWVVHSHALVLGIRQILWSSNSQLPADFAKVAAGGHLDKPHLKKISLISLTMWNVPSRMATLKASQTGHSLPHYLS